MAMRIDEHDWRTWGVGDLIPEDVLKRMAALPLMGVDHLHGLDVNHLEGSAYFELDAVSKKFARHGIRCFHPTVFKELKRKKLKRALAELDPDPSMDTVCAMSEILETAFILAMMERDVSTVEE
jgi:hypothetical protein